MKKVITSAWNPSTEREITCYRDVKTNSDDQYYQEHKEMLRAGLRPFGELFEAATLAKDDAKIAVYGAALADLNAEIERFTEGESEDIMNAMFGADA